MMMGVKGAGLFNETVVSCFWRTRKPNFKVCPVYPIPCCLDEDWFIYGMSSRGLKELRCRMEAMLQEPSFALVYATADAQSMPSAELYPAAIAAVSLTMHIFRSSLLSQLHLPFLQLV